MSNEKAFKLDESYNYRRKLKSWKDFATPNNRPFDCEKCHETHAHKTILLTNGTHICWYCWIHKDSEFAPTKKPIAIVAKETKPKTKVTGKSKTKKVIKSKTKKTVKSKTKITPTPIVKKTDNLKTKAKNVVDVSKPQKITTVKNVVDGSKPQKVKTLASTSKPKKTETIKTLEKIETSALIIQSPKTVEKIRTNSLIMQTPKIVEKIQVESPVVEVPKIVEKIEINSPIVETPKIVEKTQTYALMVQTPKSKDTLYSKVSLQIDDEKPITSNGKNKIGPECGIDYPVGTNSLDVINAEDIEKFDEKIISKYGRLAEQEQNEKLSLFKKVNRLKAGECSFDPNAKYAIEMIDIHKSFLNGKVIANDSITLRVRQNEIHAIIGENGAGKSTLMSILFGIYTPDKGIIRVNNEQVFFSSAKDATKVGLGMVHQHFQLVSTYTVLENVILGSELISPKFKYLGLMDTKKAKEKIKSIIDKYQLNIDINKKISKLTVGQQQKTEILKLLYRDADILIFDEPTAVLSPDEIVQFLKMVKDLKDEGKTIIIITHKFNEIKTIADRATIIRLGTFISDFNVHERTIKEMANEMVGHELSEIVNRDHKHKEEVILDVQNLVLKLKNNSTKKPMPINFQIHAGEIYAIAGVEGNGQSELVRAISGLDRRVNGKIIIDNVDVSSSSIHKRNQTGLSHIPENRQRHGLILDLPIYMNVVSNKISKEPFSKYGFLNEKEIKEYTRLLLKKYDVRGSVRGTSDARGLSGGNQQKLIVARELSHGNKLIVMMQPTRGLDLGAIEYIHNKILEEKQKGNAILLVSYELDEILSLADKIAVMGNGVITDWGDTEKMTRNKIGQIMAGKE